MRPVDLKTITIEYKELRLVSPRFPHLKNVYESLHKFAREVDNRTIWAIQRKSHSWREYLRKDDPTRGKFEAYVEIVDKTYTLELADKEVIQGWKDYAKYLEKEFPTK